jgi:hypothetical protein
MHTLGDIARFIEFLLSSIKVTGEIIEAFIDMDSSPPFALPLGYFTPRELKLKPRLLVLLMLN